MAHRERDNPRVALLTPTVRNFRQFEDAYLARYLGITLVKGTDLAVRDGELHLKTLGGLLPIQVLWRHVSDRLCDPLELDPESSDGVTGLLRCLRSRSLALTNGLGSVLVQAPALMPYLQAACNYFFKEPLQLSNVQTYWCGTPTTCNMFVTTWINCSFAMRSEASVTLLYRLRICPARQDKN